MPFVHDPGADRTFVLADGRALGYSLFGEPDGLPIVNNHGGLLCRFDVEPVHPDAVALGVRLISPDRPGIGRSSRLPDRDTLVWASDVEELLDVLEIDSFATMGWSMGGQYALAIAHRLADRVAAAAVIAGCPPMDDPETRSGLNKTDRVLTRLSRGAPRSARSGFAALGTLARRSPRLTGSLAGLGSPEPDRSMMRSHADWLGSNMAEALREPAGMVDEYRAWVRPWRFDLEDVVTPVEVWQGTRDGFVPRGWAERLATRLPRATLQLLDGEGHLVALTRRRAVLERLVTLCRP